MTLAILVVVAGRFAREVVDIADDAGVTVAGWIEGFDPTARNRLTTRRSTGKNPDSELDPVLSILPAIGSVTRLA